METVEEVQSTTAEPRVAESACIQPGSYLLELSLDWIVLRASENIHHLLRESHVTLIDEPLGRFVHAQALHDLRNLFSRLSGTTGIARAYAVRLTDEHDLVDIAFQLSDGRVLLEAVPSSGCFGECFGSVGGLVAGLANSQGQTLLDGGARRMRALTGYDRVTLQCGDARAESSRGAFPAPSSLLHDLPAIVCDADDRSVAIFPRTVDDTSAADALLRCCSEDQRSALQREGIRSSLRVPFSIDEISGEFRCESRSPREPSFELHAAAELFAQLFAMRLEIDGLKNR
jgi:light-regulated signal transduction histidine kinase (bacteriophytochrome)